LFDAVDKKNRMVRRGSKKTGKPRGRRKKSGQNCMLGGLLDKVRRVRGERSSPGLNGWQEVSETFPLSFKVFPGE